MAEAMFNPWESEGQGFTQVAQNDVQLWVAIKQTAEDEA
jgi:hypothetical protein